jgi:hypothetical protein
VQGPQLSQPLLGIGARDRAATTGSAASLYAAGGGGGGSGSAVQLPPRPPTPSVPGGTPFLPLPLPMPLARSMSAPEGGGGAPAALGLHRAGSSSGAAGIDDSSSDSPRSSSSGSPTHRSVGSRPPSSGPLLLHPSLPGSVTPIQQQMPQHPHGTPVRARVAVLSSGSGFGPGAAAGGSFEDAAGPAGRHSAGSTGSVSSLGGGRGGGLLGSGSGASSSLSVAAGSVGGLLQQAQYAAALSPRSVTAGACPTQQLQQQQQQRRLSRLGSVGGASVGGGGGVDDPPLEDWTLLESRQPEWSDELGSLTMKFLGQRIADSSSKNFLLEAVEAAPSAPGSGGGTPSEARGGMYCTPCLQFGKIANSRFSCDWRFPLSPIQSFGIFLSSFQVSC